MEGIIVVNKPINYTSRDVINKLNHVFHEKRIGHTGTLDPLATGVMIVCIGKYTKLVDMLTSLEKEYVAEITLGIKTDTLDITGNVIENNDNYKKLTYDNILKVFNEFPKKYEQTIPIYSAVKVNGKKLYEYARENIEIKLPKKNVNIYSLDLLSVNDNKIIFKTKVSKGTYIRSLISDLCVKLNCIGTMSKLERTKQGAFNIENAFTLEDILNNNYTLLSVSDIFDYKLINVSDGTRKLFVNGAIMNMDISDGNYFVKDDTRIIAIYEFKNKKGKVKIMF